MVVVIRKMADGLKLLVSLPMAVVALVGTMELADWIKKPKFATPALQRQYEEELLRMEIEKKEMENEQKLVSRMERMDPIHGAEEP